MIDALKKCKECGAHLLVLSIEKCPHCKTEIAQDDRPTDADVDEYLNADPSGTRSRRKQKTKELGSGSTGFGGDGGD